MPGIRLRFGGSGGSSAQNPPSTTTPSSSGGGFWSNWGGTIINAGAQLGSGLLSRSGISSANDANLAIARENRAWQEKMSNTAYQRAARDLELAGLNRILAFGSPATTPGGNVATMQNENAPIADAVGRGVSSALQARRLAQEIRNMKANEDLTIAQKNAIAPASTVGRGVQEIEKRLSNLDYKSMGDQVVRDYQSAKKWVSRIAKSMSLKVDRVEKLLIETAMEMDTPAGMTHKELLVWATKNIDKVKRYLARKDNFRSTQ